MYKPYFSRFLNERKGKLKAAYIAKVMTSVVAALAVTSADFVIVPADRDPFEALGLQVSASGAAGATDGSETLARAGNFGGADGFEPDDGDEGALCDYQTALAGYEAALTDQQVAVDFYLTLREACLAGAAGHADADDAYKTLGEFYYALTQTQALLDEARVNADHAYGTEIAEYKAVVKEYKAARAAYNAAMRENRAVGGSYREAVEQYNAAMEEYKRELAAYAKGLTDYGHKLTECKARQAALEADQQKFAEQIAEFDKNVEG